MNIVKSETIKQFKKVTKLTKQQRLQNYKNDLISVKILSKYMRNNNDFNIEKIISILKRKQLYFKNSICPISLKKQICNKLFLICLFVINKIEKEKNGEHIIKFLRIITLFNNNDIEIEPLKQFFNNDIILLNNLVDTLESYDLIKKNYYNTNFKTISIDKIIFKNIKILIGKKNEEDTLNEIMPFYFSNILHAETIWFHILKYKKLILKFSDFIDNFGRNIIHYCILNNNIEAIKYLLEHRPNININQSALYVSLLQNVLILDLLKESENKNKSKLEKMSNHSFRETPMQLAEKLKNSKMIKILTDENVRRKKLLKRRKKLLEKRKKNC